MTSSSIRHKLYDYIRVADDKKLHAIFNLLENEIEETNEWWKDKQFTEELDERYRALESGVDQGFTITQLQTSIQKIRMKKYGNNLIYSSIISTRAQKEMAVSWDWYEERLKGLGDKFVKEVIDRISNIQ